MIRALAFIASVAFAAAAAAQSKWVDKDGRVTYGDAPPVGASAAPMRRSAASLPQAEEAASDKADKKDDAKNRPLTAAEQDAAFRKRQEEAAKEREKQAKADSAAAAKRENCARAQSYVRTLETGRVTSNDAKGERYFLDDNQLAQESAKARQAIRDWCN